MFIHLYFQHRFEEIFDRHREEMNMEKKNEIIMSFK